VLRIARFVHGLPHYVGSLFHARASTSVQGAMLRHTERFQNVAASCLRCLSGSTLRAAWRFDTGFVCSRARCSLRILANVFLRSVLTLGVYRNDGSRIDFMQPLYLCLLDVCFLAAMPFFG